MNDNVLLWIWLKVATLDRNLEAYKLYKHFGSVENIYALTDEEIEGIDFVNSEIKTNLCNKDMAVSKEILRSCISNNVTVIPADDKRYPSQLLEIYNYPCALFIHGDFEKAFSRPMITIVGTRSCTSYGIRCAARISEILCHAGFTVVSGIADGIDNAAIKGAIDANGTIVSVIPGGIEKIEGKHYKYKVLRHGGTIISEHLPTFKQHRFVYQERNRILAGLSVGAVIIQAPRKSGAVMTANYALQQDRDVFALPGNVDMASSEGTNQLIKDGAIPIVTLRDVVDYYKPRFSDIIDDNIPEHLLVFSKDGQEDDLAEDVYDVNITAIKELDEFELMIFNYLKSGVTDVNLIVEQAQTSISNIMYALSSLEGKGLVTSLPGGTYKINI